MALLVRDPLAARARPLPLPPGGGSVRGLLRARARALNIPEESLYVKCNGRLVNAEDALQNGAVYSLEPRLCGGKGGDLSFTFQDQRGLRGRRILAKLGGTKNATLRGRRQQAIVLGESRNSLSFQKLNTGSDNLRSYLAWYQERESEMTGFGSMLRALGAQIEKTTNREACRDLSGRRLRDVNHEKAMAEWVKQQAEREAEKEQRRLERLQRKLAEPKHFFTNPDYQQQCHEMAERLEDSVLKGLQATSSKVVSPGTSNTRKRPNESENNGTKSGKRKCFWLGMEGLDDPDSSECDDDSEDDSAHASGGSCPSSIRYNENAENSNECSSSSVDSVEYSSATNAVKPLEHPECTGRDLQGETLTGEQTEFPSDENSKMAKTLKEDVQEKNEVTKALKEGEQENVSSKAQETNQLQSTEVEPIDLLAFNSAAEMEVLGLEKLKLELMALGLKCGGTLQERAARLFSVRGLSRDQIDPALFAKPSKGKKK